MLPCEMSRLIEARSAISQGFLAGNPTPPEAHPVRPPKGPDRPVFSTGERWAGIAWRRPAAGPPDGPSVAGPSDAPSGGGAAGRAIGGGATGRAICGGGATGRAGGGGACEPPAVAARRSGGGGADTRGGGGGGVGLAICGAGRTGGGGGARTDGGALGGGFGATVASGLAGRLAALRRRRRRNRARPARRIRCTRPDAGGIRTTGSRNTPTTGRHIRCRLRPSWRRRAPAPQRPELWQPKAPSPCGRRHIRPCTGTDGGRPPCGGARRRWRRPLRARHGQRVGPWQRLTGRRRVGATFTGGGAFAAAPPLAPSGAPGAVGWPRPQPPD